MFGNVGDVIVMVMVMWDVLNFNVGFMCLSCNYVNGYVFID